MERVDIRCEEDVVHARQRARDLSQAAGFSLVDRTRIATAASELARNVYRYAQSGFMEVEEVHDAQGRLGLRLIFIDAGPGIADVAQAMGDGYSTSGGMGIGLPGSRRLMDEFHLESAPGRGTRVEVCKWQR